jgi:hypothetical protein
MTPSNRRRRFAAAAMCVAVVSSCAADGPPTIDLVFRKPADPQFLNGVDVFVFSVNDARGQPWVLRRFSPTQPLRLDDVPYGLALAFALDGLFADTPIVSGRSCSVDVVAGQPLPHVSMLLGPVGTFVPTASPVPPSRQRPLALARQDGRVLLGGGSTADGVVLASAQQYDARSGLWAADHDLLVPRADAAWAPLPGGALVVGGVGLDGAPVSQIDRYDEKQGFREVPSDTALALSDLAVAALPGGAVLIAGGRAGVGAPPVNRAWIYQDDRAAVVPVAGGLISARRSHTLSVVGTGNFTAAFAIGGYGDAGAPLGSIELYDSRGTAPTPFSLTAAALAIPRAEHSATVLQSGDILIVGGRGEPQGAPLREAEILDPLTKIVRPAGTLAEGRVAHTATLLADGRVLVTGGTGLDGPLASAEIYDPGVGDFVAARALGTPRAGHVAVPLCDGTILIVGGGAGAEIYGPKR